MTLARQTARALSAVGQLDTALLFDVDGRLCPRSLGLGLVLFLLFCLCRPSITGVVCLALLGIRLACRSGGLAAAVLVTAVVVLVVVSGIAAVVALGAVLFRSGIAGVLGLFLLPLLFLLSRDAVFYVRTSDVFRHRPATVIALDQICAVVHWPTSDKRLRHVRRNGVEYRRPVALDRHRRLARVARVGGLEGLGHALDAIIADGERLLAFLLEDLGEEAGRDEACRLFRGS